MAELHRQCGQEEMSIKSALAGQCSSSQPCTLQCTGLHQRAEVKAKAMKGNVKRLHRFADTHLEATTCRDVKSSLPVVSRRETMGISMLVVSTCIPLFLLDPSADARQRRNTQNIPIDQYKTSSTGIKYYDVSEGSGLEARKGSTVLVHFDCVYKGLTVVSSRESKLLVGNRVIAQEGNENVSLWIIQMVFSLPKLHQNLQRLCIL
eukprot:TRINITY_DN1059_c0_g1_i4.p1 TRINITY_DN1059_c0_g1~~TRINITY_DN1059_c0_g1_i4.p1  ORF type:complete len:206 (+),score=29.59 TRINITY_DN1059_c0_g1_i4:52-669(+)